ncbi:MAG TPA: lysozyme inhibitor LprI family protein [Acidobacteriaceae bacterium]
MRVGIVVMLLVLTGSIAAEAQNGCQYFSQAAGDQLERALRGAPSCDAAAAKFKECAWGSSADSYFGSLVRDKCDKELSAKLLSLGKRHLDEEIHLCAYRYAKQQGTMYISEASVCTAEVEGRFATHPERAGAPEPKASFDCSRARTSLERAICVDPKLGEADIVLGRVYRDTMQELPETDHAEMIAREKEWLAGTQKQCGVGSAALSATERACIQDAFEKRFTALDGCAVDPQECSDRSADE